MVADYEFHGLLGTSTPYAVMCYTRHKYWEFGVSNAPSRYYRTSFRDSLEIRCTQEMSFQLLLDLQELLWAIRDARAQGVQLPNARLFDIDHYDKIIKQAESIIDSRNSLIRKKPTH